MYRSKFITFLYLIAGFFLLNACDKKDQSSTPIVTLSGFTMGTSYNIKLNHESDNIDSKLLKSEINKILLQINNQMSTYQEDSELSKINKSRTLEWINISADLFTVINTAISISNKTTGAFDITIGPIVNLWGFGPTEQTEQIPTDKNIATVLKSTGYQYLHLRKSPHALKKDKEDIYIDLSAIAKGYAVDKISTRLDQLAIKNYMVELGGEIKVKGVNHQNVPWQIGIERPVIGHRSAQKIINLDNLAMATSGDYRNYFEKNGIYYSHTINPRTGRPVSHQLASVTVFHENAMYADALATSLLVMGPEAGKQLAEQENWAAFFIIRNKNNFIEIKTKAFEQLEPKQ